MNKLSFRINKNADPRDLQGFIRVLSENGYEVSFRKASGASLMCDVSDSEAVIRTSENKVPIFGRKDQE